MKFWIVKFVRAVTHKPVSVALIPVPNIPRIVYIASSSSASKQNLPYHKKSLFSITLVDSSCLFER